MRLVGALAPAAVFLAACASRPPHDSSPAPGPSAQLVNAIILANGCQDLGKASAKAAENTMEQLVEDCTSVPGGSARFQATLQPGGRIEIASAGTRDQPDVVPVCILKHSLLHKVPLSRPCRLDVKIEQTSVQMPPLPDASAD